LFFANKTTKNKFLSSYLLIYAHQIEREGSEAKGKEGKRPWAVVAEEEANPNSLLVGR
jgi:hypothetical protein